MAIIQVRDVPEDVHAELTRRAEEAHQSLQQYLKTILVKQARRPDPKAFWSDVADRLHDESSSYGLDEAVADIRTLRDEER